MAIKSTIDAIQSFVNPFSISDKDHLYSISSGMKVPTEIETDVLRAEGFGEREKERFVNERLKANEKFFDPIKRSNLKTMEDLSKKAKVTTKQNKVIELKQQGNIAFQLLVKSQDLGGKLDLKEIMKYQLTPVPYCFGSSDGFLGKTNKAKGIQYLLQDVDDARSPESSSTLQIIDGNAIFHCLSDLPDTFGEIAEKIFKTMPKESDVVFSTDMYNEKSIKSQERIRRGCSERYLVKGPSVRRPANWKDFLSNDDNKDMLTDILLSVWSDNSFASHIAGRKVGF